MKTTIHAYYFDCAKPEDNAQYKELVKRLKSEGLNCFCTWGNDSHYLKKADGITVDLDTSPLFDDQWNTAPIDGISENGLRVFDWAEDYPIDFRKSIKRGHYLDITPEMREIRRNTHKCRYCGKMEPAQKGYVFCPHCIGSEYLTIKDLKLTRMKAVDDNSDCAELSQAEKDYLIPLYKDAQLHGNAERDKARIAKQRGDLLKEYESTKRKAEIKFKGFSWLMDHGIKTDNVIYYDHVNRFSFGWRNPVDVEMVDDILNVISEFPYAYEIKGSVRISRRF